MMSGSSQVNMPWKTTCKISKNKGFSVFLAACLLTTMLTCAFLMRFTQPSFIANMVLESTDLEDGAPGTIKEQPADKPYVANISVLVEQLKIPHEKWMNERVVNPFPYKFVHNPHKTCVNRSVEILVAMPVSRANFEQRQAVRETWGAYAKDPNNNAVLLFFLGSLREDEYTDIQRRIDEEYVRHQDIVQANYLDTYRNLTVKSVSILRWADEYCPQIDFLLKADDDMYIVLPTLVSHLRENSKKSLDQRFILGVVIVGAVPVQDKTSKWYTPKKDFPEKVYPKYVSGTSYSMTGKAARLIYQAALRTPIFWLEDIYITGLCSRKANVPVINDWSQTYSKPTPNGCVFKKFITGHRYKVSEIRQIHRELQDKNLKCPIPTDNST